MKDNKKSAESDSEQEEHLSVEDIHRNPHNGMLKGAKLLLIPCFIIILIMGGLIILGNYITGKKFIREYDFSEITQSSGPQEALRKKYELLVYSGIKNSYKGFRSQEDCEAIAAKAIMMMLDDEYAAYYTAEEAEQLIRKSSGSYRGIGVTIGLDQSRNSCVITDVADNSSAYKAGIKPGDIIMKVNGKAAEKLNTAEMAELIRETEDKVKLTVLRQGELMEIAAEAGEVVENHTEYEVIDGKIGYIKLDEFSGDCVNQMKLALLDIDETVEESGEGTQCEGYIIDLRGNTGGELYKAMSLIGYFTGADITASYLVDNTGARTDYKTPRYRLVADNAKVVVLVDGLSASASEMMAGAFRDLLEDKVKIVGEVTFGKGVAQELFEMSDGSIMKFTTGEYFTPKGTKVDGIGIIPDIQIHNSGAEGKDEQLDKAIELANEMVGQAKTE